MKLFEKAKEPKRLVLHESGHSIPFDKAIEETVNWLRESLPHLFA
jgi:hypothetical protein